MSTTTRSDRVIVTSGKLYYDLADERARTGLRDLPILRVEQLHPFPTDMLARNLAGFRGCGTWSGRRKRPGITAHGIWFATNSKGVAARSVAGLHGPCRVGIERDGQRGRARGRAASDRRGCRSKPRSSLTRLRDDGPRKAGPANFAHITLFVLVGGRAGQQIRMRSLREHMKAAGSIGRANRKP